MEKESATWTQQIQAVNDGKAVKIGIHLIYAMAMPCDAGKDCLGYLRKSIVKDYIEPAAERGWVVVLDSQLGRSSPAAQVQHMIDEGYLKYENVHVALDPEFHVVPGHARPGTPIGTIEASEVNEAQKILNDYVAEQRLKTKKILIIHQFGDRAVHDGVPYMIRDKESVLTYPNVELVIDMDGLGAPPVKVRKYNLITSHTIYPFIQFQGIKVFFNNKWEHHGHYDKPPLTVDEIFGQQKLPGGLRMKAKPDIVIIA
jgi:hypothetical protein